MKSMKNKLLMLLAMGFLLFFILNMSFSLAETTCKRTGCTITITIKVAFSETDNVTIQKWVQDVESIWNGYTFGDCECEVKVKVDWKNIGNASCQSNYGSTEPGYHCIHVSNTTHVTVAGNTYRGFMWGVSKRSSSIAGFWGTSMNSPLPGVQGEIHDAAHEAGHMMGLNDTYDAATGTYPPNIMGRTWGNDSKPTQSQIDQIVGNNCKSDDTKCPDICCCGNGKIEKAKSEECEKSEDCKEGANPLCVSCKCFYIDICGDGVIGKDEECDPNSANETCASDERCNPETCVCEEKPAEVKVTITNPDDGEEIPLGELVIIKVDIDSDLEIDKVEFYVNGDLEKTRTSEPWEWSFDSSDYDVGDHKIKVIAYDEEGNKDSDSIDIEIIE